MSARDDRAEAMREAAKALFLLGTEHGGDPGTFDRDSAEIRASWDSVFEKAWSKSPLRALPLATAPIATPADDAVARARERVVEAAMAWRGTNTDDYRLNMAVDALLAAERAAKGGATTGAADCDDAPAPEFTCPKCGSHEFGTSNCTSPVSAWVGHCHRPGCRFSWPRESDDIKYFTPRLAEHDGNGGA